jgi:pSer/pThr/pTyr-binding forkhead associated (FHA) protein
MKTPSVRLHQFFRLDSARMEIGRSYDTPIFLDDRTVSMRHAAIRYERVKEKDEFVLYDLASTNGTYLNDVSIHLAVLKDNDRIRVGETEMAFKKVEEARREPDSK